MPDRMSESESSAIEKPPDKNPDLDDSEFVEMDPTGRYGRYQEVLGKGAFKTVYRAFDELDGLEVAWNQVKIQDLLQSLEESERLYSEVHLLKSLKHKNIIKFYNSWVDTKSKNVNFITEIFTSGTLRQYRKKHKHVDIKAVKNWARQILRGLLYLHSHDPPIIHRDLKCDNIFVNGNNGEVKIGDLGLATILRQAHAAHSVIGTPEFMAPELYEEDYNELVDIYSFGMCLLELVTFEYPYSECTNAAQIYKKVTSGKKPAALERIKNMDVRQFIEKCLAVASKRSPARELLADPFLQSESSREHLECLLSVPHLELVGDDMEELILKEPASRHHRRASGLTDSFSLAVRSGYESGHSMSSTSLLLNGGNKGNSNVDCVPSQPSSSSKDDQPRRSRDFRVKGKKRDEGTVFLRLRIADTQGHVRNIHFLFDIEGDTAMSVASEMVEELDLSDQDVTTIAEMIDAEILALVPEWKPGASFDETGPDTEDCGDQVELSPDCGFEKAKSDTGGNDCTDVDDPHIETVPLNRKIHSPSFRLSAYAGSPTRGEGTMHGRFEEVTYNHCSSDYSPSSSGAALSSNPSEHHTDDEVTCVAAGPCSSFSDHVGGGAWSTVLDTMGSQHVTSLHNTGDTEPTGLGCAAFNDLVESQRNAGSCKYTHQTWEGIMSLPASPDGHVEFTEGARNGLGEAWHGQPSWPICGLALEGVPDLVVGEELDRELKLLTLKQEQELMELQKKHEQAILEVKNRRDRRSGSTPSSNLASPDMMQSGSPNFVVTTNCSGNQGGSQGSMSSHESAVKVGHIITETFESVGASPKGLAAVRDGIEGEETVESANLEQCFSGGSEAQAVVVPNSGASDQKSLAIVTGPRSQAQATAGCDVVSYDTGRGTLMSGQQLCQPVETSLHGLGMRGAFESHAPVEISASDGQQELHNPPSWKVAHSDPVKIRTPEKSDQMAQGRHASYTELYKSGSIERNKLYSTKVEPQAGEAGVQELLSKSCSSKSDDRALELKKEQLQRSIAELEAKTLEGLHCSKNGFLASHALKKPFSGTSAQSGSSGSNASQTRPHPISESNKV